MAIRERALWSESIGALLLINTEIHFTPRFTGEF